MVIRLVMLCQMLGFVCVSIKGEVMMVGIVTMSVIRMVKLIHALNVVIVMFVLTMFNNMMYNWGGVVNFR